MCGYCVFSSHSIHGQNYNPDDLDLPVLQAEAVQALPADEDDSDGLDGPVVTTESFTSGGLPDYIDALLGRHQNVESNHIRTWSGEVEWNPSLGGYQITANPAPGTAVTIKYEINHNHQTIYSNTHNLDAAEENAIRTALDMWDNIANINFVEVTDGTGDIGFYAADLPISVSGGGYSYTAGIAHTATFSNGHIHYSDVYLTSTLNPYTGQPLMSYEVGGEGWSTAIHEVGHALGLKHPGNYNGSGSGAAPFLPADRENTDLSIMAYDMGWSDDADTYTFGNGKAPETPMLYDIAAMQYLYGANTSYNSGDTTITLQGDQKFWAVWDGGGNDTIDASGVTGNHTLNLNAGDGMENVVGNEVLWVAYNANIENATGGSGNDSITGNALDNVLAGNAGANQLTGGSGNDTFVIASAGGAADTVTDFAVNADKLDLSAHSGLYFDDLNLSTSSGHAVLNLGSQTVTLNNVSHTLLDADDFIGVSAGSGSTPGSVINGTASGGYTNESLTNLNLGTYYTLDFNSDGFTDIISHGGTYGNTLVWIDGITLEASSLITGTANYELADANGDGIMDIFTDALGGIGYYDGTDGTTFTRVSDHSAGDFKVGDIDGDGTVEVVANEGSYSNGNPMGGLVKFELDGTLARINYHPVDNWSLTNMDGDAALEIVSNEGDWASGDNMNGLVYYDGDGTFNRITFNNVGDYRVADVDDDGTLEIVSANGFYPSGSSIGGIVYYEFDGTPSRITFNNAGTFEVADYDNDGTTEIISTGGSFASGASFGGTVEYDDTGTLDRVNYIEGSEIEIADLDGDGALDVLLGGGSYGAGFDRWFTGDASDSLTGTSGDDTITGGGGRDNLSGGGGNDIFHFGANFSVDTIADFAEGDILRFSGVSGAGSAAAVVNAASVVDGDTIIKLAGDGAIILSGFTGLDTGDISII